MRYRISSHASVRTPTSVRTRPAAAPETAVVAPQTDLAVLHQLAAPSSTYALNPHSVQALQRALGNQATAQLLTQRQGVPPSPTPIQRAIGPDAQLNDRVTSKVFGGDWEIVGRTPPAGPATEYTVKQGAQTFTVKATNSMWDLATPPAQQPAGGQAPGAVPVGGQAPQQPAAAPPAAQPKTILNAQQLYQSVIDQFTAWNKADFFPTGVTGPTPDGQTVQTHETTGPDFQVVTARLAQEFGAMDPKYYCRSALSNGAKFEATDIIISTSSTFAKEKPKMVFHIWGKY